MVKKNFFTDAMNGFFEFISTGHTIADNFIRRLVVTALLLSVILASVGAIVTSADVVYTKGETLVVTLMEGATDTAKQVEVLAEEAITESSALISEIESALTADEYVDTTVEFPDSDVPLVDGTLE